MAHPDDASEPFRPALRNLQVERTEQDGREGVALTDPLGIAQGPVFVPDGLLPVVSRFDGTMTVAEIEADLELDDGQTLPEDLVPGLAEQLGDLLYLDGPKYRKALKSAMREFRDQDSRPAVHPGRTAGLPGEPEALREALDSIVHRPKGYPDHTANLRPTPRGLVAPHIDVARGREGYSLAYSALAECEPADLYVVFGTGHQGPQAPVTGLPMDWETPLGTVRTDKAFVEAVHKKLGPPHPGDLLLHRQEHSLEFQMVFLKHVLGDRDFEVAGFLTGHLLGTRPSIAEEPMVQNLLEAFRTAVETKKGKKVCFVAGADLAHIGPFFGDPAPIDQARLDRLTAEELPKLKHLENGDPAAFYHAVENGGNQDRICGTTPMFLAASLADGPARLLHYGQATAEDGHQTVSYCSMVIE